MRQVEEAVTDKASKSERDDSFDPSRIMELVQAKKVDNDLDMSILFNMSFQVSSFPFRSPFLFTT